MEKRICEMNQKYLHFDAAKLYPFLQTVLPRFMKFNIMFQRRCFQLIASFVQFDIIQKFDITAADFNIENQHTDAGIFVGYKTRSFLETCDASTEKKEKKTSLQV
ncbi:hypothetical protein PR048_017746 [Dryococelus australis]|uniref:DNA-directed DNA polymerase n=1 Tax=Dryococelus australis TaxID=614101 RepID=A0ABQ9HAH0_9NEOP|nr:hypothetical protein PR048_017746 [Dryococelus australis]